MADISDEAVADRTGRTFPEWFKLLDKWGAIERPHKEIAAHLADERGVEPWWAQTITVAYERARGLRAVGERAGGHYEASAQRTLDASPAQAERALKQPERWNDDEAALRILRTVPRASNTAHGKVLRYAAGDARLEVALMPRPDGRCTVRVTQGALPSADARAEARKRWTTALDALKASLQPA